MSLLDSEIEIIDKISIKDLIIEWLKNYEIRFYKINDDLTIDANWNVKLPKYPEPQLPDYIQFNKVVGCFNIANSQIENLKGCPKIVKGDFNCSWCKNLKTLKGAPEKVEGYFSCSNCKKLESLEGSPESVTANFYCAHCPKLKITESYYKKYKII